MFHLLVPLMMASESCDKNNVGRRVEHVELVIIEMACKTKTTLTRSQRDKRVNAESEIYKRKRKKKG